MEGQAIQLYIEGDHFKRATSKTIHFKVKFKGRGRGLKISFTVLLECKNCLRISQYDEKLKI